MLARITHIALPVANQQEALDWYMDKLGFEKRSDSVFADGTQRWLTMSPKNQPELEIVLQLPEWGLISGDPNLRSRLIGQTPGWVIVSDDCQADYEILQSRGVEFVNAPTEMPWGVSAVLKDLYGNVHNLLQPFPVDTSS